MLHATMGRKAVGTSVVGRDVQDAQVPISHP